MKGKAGRFSELYLSRDIEALVGGGKKAYISYRQVESSKSLMNIRNVGAHSKRRNESALVDMKYENPKSTLKA